MSQRTISWPMSMSEPCQLRKESDVTTLESIGTYSYITEPPSQFVTMSTCVFFLFQRTHQPPSEASSLCLRHGSKRDDQVHAPSQSFFQNPESTGSSGEKRQLTLPHSTIGYPRTQPSIERHPTFQFERRPYQPRRLSEVCNQVPRTHQSPTRLPIGLWHGMDLRGRVKGFPNP